MTLKIAARATRAGEIVSLSEVSDAAEHAREIEISFSSESPILRAFWDDEAGALRHYHEVLGHTEGEIDFSRLNSGAAPLLKDHEPRIDSQIGVVVRAWIAEGQGRAVVRFSASPSADDVLARVRAGDVTCVSVGYGIAQAEKDGTAEDGLPIVRATRWVPREISFVAIPADQTVGYGRAAGGDVDSLTIKEPAPMPEQQTTQETETRAAAPAAPVPANPGPSTEDAVRAAVAADRARVAEIEAIAEHFDMPADAVRKAKDNGTTADAFRKIVMDKIAGEEAEETRAGQTRIGLSESEIRAFSILNVVRYLDNPTDRNRERAAFELDASRAAAQVMGRDPEGVFIPNDVLMDASFARASVGTSGAPGGGYSLVATDHMSGSFIEMLRKKAAITGLGVTYLTGLVGNIDIPKQVGGSTVYWLGEGEDGTDSDVDTGIVSMSPKTMAVAVPITRKLMKQGAPDAEALVRRDLITEAALALSGAVLVNGTVANAPTSLRSRLIAAGGDRVVQWFDTTNDVPDFKEMVQLETNVNAADADEGEMGYVYGAKLSGHLKTTAKFAGGETPIEVGREVNGYRRVRSNQVPDFEAMFGAWSNVIVGMWGGLDLRVDRATLAKSDGVVLRAFQDLDTCVRHLEGFTLGQPTP